MFKLSVSINSCSGRYFRSDCKYYSAFPFAPFDGLTIAIFPLVDNHETEGVCILLSEISWSVLDGEFSASGDVDVSWLEEELPDEASDAAIDAYLRRCGCISKDSKAGALERKGAVA